MPLVKAQVQSQIRVADLSKLAVSIHPADHSSWSQAADQLTKEAVAPLKAEQRRSLKRADGDADAISRINAEFAERIEAEQAMVATHPLEFFVELETKYNFL